MISHRLVKRFKDMGTAGRVLVLMSSAVACFLVLGHTLNMVGEQETGFVRVEYVYCDLAEVTSKGYGSSTEGGVIDGLYIDGCIAVLTARIYGEGGSVQKTYNFHDGVIAISVSAKYYSEPIYVSPGPALINDVQEKRYMLVGERLYEVNEIDDKLMLLTETERRSMLNEMNEYVLQLEQSGSRMPVAGAGANHGSVPWQGR